MENTDSSRTKITLIFIVSLLFVAIVSTCAVMYFVPRENRNEYDEAWIIGKTKDQIVEKYGDFESYFTVEDPDGSFCYNEGVYIVKPAEKRIWTTYPPIIFEILFNSDGIAYACYEGYEMAA